MITALIILAILFSVAGIIGCFVPGLPGTPLNYIGMLCLHWSIHSFNISTLIFYGALTLLVLAFDYLIPIWTAKKYGTTKEGIRGSIIGMIVGFFFSPVGMILGTIAGAVIGDMVAGKTPDRRLNREWLLLVEQL